MATGLDQLLDSISPDRTLEQVSARADQALNSLAPPRSCVRDWDEFRYLLIRFMLHVEAHCLRLRQPLDPATLDADYCWGRCVQTLMELYGASGDRAAFEIARTGNEGGLYSVLKKVGRRIAEDLGKTEISAKVSSCWEALSVQEQLALADEYLHRYGHLLPSELTEGSAARVRANMPRVLQEHPHLIQRLRSVGRT